MLAGMQVRFHSDVAEFASIAVPLFERDPLLHTVELTLLRGNALDADSPLLVTVWDDGRPVGAALQTPPQPLLCTGLPATSISTVVDEVIVVRPDMPGVRGVRDTALTFAQRWQARTGATVVAEEGDRLYRLGVPRWPQVPGASRLGTAADHDVLVAWLCAFAAEAFEHEPDPARAESAIAAAGANGDVYVLWTVDGSPVSIAGVRRPASGVARIGPVYTPETLRGNGYGSAATADAARWALAVGAVDVVLFADLANPVSNAVYQRMGFEPVADTVRVAFTV